MTAEPRAEGLREALINAMTAHDVSRVSGAYPHLGQDNDIRRFVDRILDWMEENAATPPQRAALDVEARDAIEFTAIPTLLVFAEDNAGVREAIQKLRKVLL